ncbi:macrophage colony-stimulating factor 1a [Pygocentrus nattereri]|uniref:Colony stimulating factor 1b (macrophage) n=1 Tax=Pygocentrus nattereri TaxID=42514 RepID=A0A3B4DV27_PYGNA|nr:macrophage colony-stimulating factor 1a [Pygocentrus nattereri]XP_017550202.1 macrophage colony-stimulating factor 1a [Pygocentrus nattereri]
MNTNTPAHKAKIRHLCSFLVLCLHLANGAVPGPCKHSVTKDHLLNLRRLIGNQLQNGCSISYNFTERQSLSDICYIKAAFPHMLDLLNTHFRYERDSDNYNYVSSLKNLIYNIYSQRCIPPINEETEDNPVKFAKLYKTSPRVGLEKAEEVIQMYQNLVTKNDKPVEWNCEDEYVEDSQESTTAHLTQMSGTPECKCSCTKMSSTLLKALPLTRFSLSAPTTISPTRPYQEPVFSYKNVGSRASEPGVKQKATKIIQAQSSPVSPDSESYGTTAGNFPNLIFSTTLDLTDGKVESSPSSVLSSSITSSTKLARIPQKKTLLVLHSATSQPSQRSITPLNSHRSTALLLAKRSLDTKDQGILSDFFSKLLQSWITTATSDSAGIHKKGVQITPRATVYNPFQTLHAEVTAAPSLKIMEDISEYISTPAEQSVDVSTPTHIQTHLHMAASLPENVIKAFSEATDCKDSKCQKDTEDMKAQISRDHVERPLEKDFQLTSSSINTALIITSACLALMLIAALLFCKQQRNIRRLFQRPRGTSTQRSSIYDKIEL